MQVRLYLFHHTHVIPCAKTHTFVMGMASVTMKWSRHLRRALAEIVLFNLLRYALSASARLKCLLHFIVTLAIPITNVCVLAQGITWV